MHNYNSNPLLKQHIENPLAGTPQERGIKEWEKKGKTNIENH